MRNTILQRKNTHKTCGNCGENMNDCECWHGGVRDN